MIKGLTRIVAICYISTAMFAYATVETIQDFWRHIG